MAASGHKGSPIDHQKTGASSATVRLRPFEMVKVLTSMTAATINKIASRPSNISVNPAFIMRSP